MVITITVNTRLISHANFALLDNLLTILIKNNIATIAMRMTVINCPVDVYSPYNLFIIIPKPSAIINIY